MAKKVLRTIAFQVDDWDFLKQYDQRQQESGLSVKNYFVGLIKADIALHQKQTDAPAQEKQDGGVQDIAFEWDQTVEPFEEEIADIAEIFPDDETDIQQDEPSETVQAEETMNLFVKITREQRDALDAHKNETGETVGSVLNRVIEDFLDHTDSLPDGFEEAFQRYSENLKECNTTTSAKIPVHTNGELTDYLNSFGGSRNALMAALVELELKGQELTETQDEGMTMQ